MRLLLSFIALLFSIALLQLSSGTIGTLDALSGLKTGFSRVEIGLLGSAHFVGFFIGCFWAPRLIGSIGHSRTFAIFATMGAIGVIAHPIFINAYFWLALRLLSGMCVAGCYTVIEAWFQAKVTNEIRGRVMSAYRIVDISASSISQLMIAFLTPASYISYNIIAILACIAILPLTLTQSEAPKVPKAPRLHPIRTALTSPLGVAGVITAGVTTSSFRMVGPIYGSDIGLTTSEIGSFLASVLIGGALAQFPVGYLADKFDRRRVLVGISIASIMVCIAFMLMGETTKINTYILAFIFGATTFPIFSISAAHANDFTSPEERVELNASLMFFYAIGAVFSPLIASALIQKFGPSAMFSFITLAHVCLVIFSLGRMSVRSSSSEKTKYRYMPRTSFTIGKLIKRRNLD